MPWQRDNSAVQDADSVVHNGTSACSFYHELQEPVLVKDPSVDQGRVFVPIVYLLFTESHPATRVARFHVRFVVARKKQEHLATRRGRFILHGSSGPHKHKAAHVLFIVICVFVIVQIKPKFEFAVVVYQRCRKRIQITFGELSPVLFSSGTTC